MKHIYADLFSLVEKPLRYLGGEPGSIVKNGLEIRNRIALAFPDAYEVGSAHLGLSILYQCVNAHPQLAAERVFAPWPDMEALLRERNLPLVTLETQTPLRQFPLVGFSLQFELHFTNILQMLELGGIPLRRQDRSENDPIIIAGGPLALHAAPLFDFIDVFALGDGEDLLVSWMLADAQHREAGWTRKQRIEALACLPHAFSPGLAPSKPVTVARVKLDGSYPAAFTGPIPFVSVFSRAAIELARGCNQGCRFCQAGMTYRPFRELPPHAVVNQIQTALLRMGYPEVGLTALSTLDYTGIERLLPKLASVVQSAEGSLSVASLRAYGLTPEVVGALRTGRGGNLTFAPEAGTDRLRNVINKNVTTADLLETVALVAQMGFSRIKLYFMCGLPTETQTDLEAIAHLGHQVHQVARKASVGKALRVTVSVSNFVPKPHTPFETLDMTPTEVLREKHRFIEAQCNHRWISLRFHDPAESVLEAAFARGGPEMGRVVLYAYQQGARFDGWQDHFNPAIWYRAFDVCGMALEDCLRGRAWSENNPWSYVDVGVSRAFLQAEQRRAFEGRPTPPCLVPEVSGQDIVCHGCGAACNTVELLQEKQHILEDILSFQPALQSTPTHLCRVLFTYAKSGHAVYLSHLELIDHFPRILRAAGLKLKYTEGFHPKPKMSFGPALGQRMEGLRELLEVFLENEPQESIDDVLARMNANAVSGLHFLFMEILDAAVPPLSRRLTHAVVAVHFPENSVNVAELAVRAQQLEQAEKIPLVRHHLGKDVVFDAKPSLTSLSVSEESGHPVLRMRIRLLTTSQIRPTDVLALLVPHIDVKDVILIREGFELHPSCSIPL